MHTRAIDPRAGQSKGAAPAEGRGALAQDRYVVSRICFSSAAYFAPYLSRIGCVAL
jgi:hypothetical protein